MAEFDTNFSEAEFLTKVDNIYVMYCMSLMTNNLDRVAHFLTPQLYEQEKARLASWEMKNLQPMYGELNVKTSSVVRKTAFDTYDEVEVRLETRFLDYFIDKTTKAIVSGDNQNRKQHNLRLIFQKNKQVKEHGLVRKCPNCGANMDLNQTGICPYCNQVFSQENYDWMLNSIEEI